MTRVRGDAGFTLTEMLIAFVILGILMVPLAGSVVTSLVAVDRSQQRISDSTDSQILGFHFIQDVQSSHAVSTTGSCAPAGATPVLEMSWTDPATSATHVAAYATLINGSATELHRYACGSTSGDVLVGRAVTGPVSVECKSDANVAVTCTGTARTVRISFTDRGDLADDAPYQISMTATRRES